MVKKESKPYDKLGLALLVIFLLATLVAPSVAVYVNDTSPDLDKDIQSSVILENAIVRLVDRGELKFSEKLTSEIVEERIKGVLGEIPEIHQQGSSFCMNIKDGSVNIRKAKGPEEIIINNIPGD